MDELRGCPFCGGAARVSIMHVWVSVKCDNCGARIGPSATENLTALWNRRVYVTPPEVIERIYDPAIGTGALLSNPPYRGGNNG